MSGLAQLSYVTAVCSPGRWGAMGSSQFGRTVQKYTGHIHMGVHTYLMLFLKCHNWKRAFALKRCKIWIYFQFSNPEVSIIVLITIFLKWLLRHLWGCRVFALSLWLQGWMGDCSRVLMTTPVGPINSPRLLEHQVMANQALNLQPGLTALTLPQLQLRTSRAHSWVS